MKCILKWMMVFCIITVSLQVQAQARRIITLSGALSETVHAMGLGDHIVAVDVTSEYPDAIKRKPRVSKDRTASLEGLLAFKPDLILAPAGELTPAIENQLKKLGVRLVTTHQEYSLKGAQRFIREVGYAVGRTDAGEKLAQQVENTTNQTLNKLLSSTKKPKVLFIYAQGVGMMSVAGKGSHIDAMITLAGGRNAVQEFNDFKPYSTEALVKANPDVILLFDFGMSSLGGRDAVLRMPGMSLTNAGKNKRIIAMDGPLLINFSTRLSQAIHELNHQLYTP